MTTLLALARTLGVGIAPLAGEGKESPPAPPPEEKAARPKEPASGKRKEK